MALRSPDDLVMEIKLERARRKELAFVLVEGPDDAKFWKSRADQDWSCIIAHGKRNVLGCISHPSVVQPVFGIVDADYDHLDAVECAVGVCRTDAHDLECMLHSSSAFGKVLAELGSPGKITSFEASNGPVLERLESIAGELAALRRLNHVRGWGLKFKKTDGQGATKRIDYGKFIDKTTWTCDRGLMIQTVLNYDSRHDPSNTQIAAELSAVVPPTDHWHWLNGHDLAAILAIGLSRVLGSTNRSGEEVEQALRLGFEHADLAVTQLFCTIQAWEATAGRRFLNSRGP